MSELETKEQNKELTFEEICPEWSRRIANYDKLSDKVKLQICTDLSNPKICFVGEACDWGKETKCEECREIHMGYRFGLCGPFDDHYTFGEKFNWKVFNQRKDAFVKHWNEKHGKK